MQDYSIEINGDRIRVRSFAEGWEVGKELRCRSKNEVRLLYRNRVVMQWEA